MSVRVFSGGRLEPPANSYRYTVMTKKVVARTGEKAPPSGQYRPAGSRHEITLSKGDRVPPNNQGTQQRFTLVDKTKHKR